MRVGARKLGYLGLGIRKAYEGSCALVDRNSLRRKVFPDLTHWRRSRVVLYVSRMKILNHVLGHRVDALNIADSGRGECPPDPFG